MNTSDIALFAHHPVHYFLSPNSARDCSEETYDKGSLRSYECAPGRSCCPAATDCAKRAAAELGQFLSGRSAVDHIDTGEREIHRGARCSQLRSEALQRLDIGV